MTTFRVTHVTEYRYNAPVESSYGHVHLLPRDTPSQQCRTAKVSIEPRPVTFRERVDFFGNRAAYFEIGRPHRALRVEATSAVEVTDTSDATRAAGAVAGPAWEAVRDSVGVDDRQFVLSSPRVPALAELSVYAAASFPSGRPLLDALADLCRRIHSDFAYDPDATTVSTPLDEVVRRRHGVCQDFAHVGLGAVRAMGLAARYVSGYLETVPPPGTDRVPGGDQSHAWLSVWAGPAGWVDIDPTNNTFVSGGHVTNAWGRDYDDVAPLKGVIFTDARSHELTVTVDVLRDA